MTLVQRLTKLHARLNGLHTKFGEYQYLPVVVHHKCKHDQDIRSSFHLIQPNPRVENVSTRFVGTQVSQSIYINANDVQVTEVIRTESIDWFRENVEYYCIDPEIDDRYKIVLDAKGNPTKGSFYKLLYLLDKDTTSLTLILRKFKDVYR